uniref:cDNA FLJ27242 fis, clone SYN08010 n=1 Tax=Homo sapiens TaxID=9606 RepID=Q6ZNS4_HUMAN|nr:unnamed protein product [Homo sapiens]
MTFRKLLICLDFLDVLERMGVALLFIWKQVELLLGISLYSFLTGISDAPVTGMVRMPFPGPGERMGGSQTCPCEAALPGEQRGAPALSRWDHGLGGPKPLPHPYCLADTWGRQVAPGSCFLEVCPGAACDLALSFPSCPKRCHQSGPQQLGWAQESCALVLLWLMVIHTLVLF